MVYNLDDLIELQNKCIELENKYKELETNHANVVAENNQLKQDKIDLQAHCQELFIRCTSPVEQTTGEPKIKSYEELAKEMRGK